MLMTHDKILKSVSENIFNRNINSVSKSLLLQAGSGGKGKMRVGRERKEDF